MKGGGRTPGWEACRGVWGGEQGGTGTDPGLL